MSMPEFPKPNPDLNQEQALTMILSSIALEEAALSHIINAEGEKIQYILGSSHCGKPSASVQDILAVNKSVTKLLEVVMQNQILLKNKMDSVLEHLPYPQRPPHAPEKPCHPVCSCKPKECCSFESFSSFEVLPKVYCYNEPLQWIAKSNCTSPAQKVCGCNEIQLSGDVPFVFDFYAEFEHLGCMYEGLELIISCKDKPAISRKIQINCLRSGEFCERICINPPYSCFPCNLSIVVRTLSGISISKGGITHTKS